MSLWEQYRKHEQYIKRYGLDRLIDFKDFLHYKKGMIDPESGEAAPKPPEPDDLVRLHKLIRQRRSMTVLEFGVGYSTIIMADALLKNQEDWNKLKSKPKIKNRYMFQLFCVDSNSYYMEISKARFPVNLLNHVHFHYSEVVIGTFNGQMCHYYNSLPDIVPDFIYLDGPHPKDVKGEINGLSFQCNERTVISADILLMEPTLKSGSYIVVDNRENNVWFLRNNFKRNWIIRRIKNVPLTIMELREPPKRFGCSNLPYIKTVLKSNGF